MIVAVLCVYPFYGSVWLTDVEWCGDYVMGEAEDRSVPEGHSTMNFPLSSVVKVRVADYERFVKERAA
jgi:hypothetical protein